LKRLPIDYEPCCIDRLNPPPKADKADEKYTVVVTAEGEALIRKPIRELLDVLDPAIFKQIHRSTIVNMKAIAAITRDDTGRGMIRLKDRPETLSVSLTFIPLFKNM